MAEKHVLEKGTRLKKPQRQLSEVERGNLHEKEFREIIVKLT